MLLKVEEGGIIYRSEVPENGTTTHNWVGFSDKYNAVAVPEELVLLAAKEIEKRKNG